MEELLYFIMSFILVFLFYELFVVYRRIKKKKKNKLKKDPVELLYLKNRYKIDVDKIGYNKLLHLIAVVSSLDISIVVSLISIIDNYLLALFIGFGLIIVVIVFSYHLVYLFFKKKGMIKDEWDFENWKEMAKILGRK